MRSSVLKTIVTKYNRWLFQQTLNSQCHNQAFQSRISSSSSLQVLPSSGVFQQKNSEQWQNEHIRRIQYYLAVSRSGYSTAAQKQYKESMLEKFLMVLGFSGFTQLPKSTLSCSAARLYISCSEYSDFSVFTHQFHLEDTFASWVKILQLHTWMLMVRLRNCPVSLHKDIKFLVYHLNKSMWSDLDKRSKKLASGSIRKDSMAVLMDGYKALILGYDEGLLTTDTTLAAALWRYMFNMEEDIEPETLCHLVKYIHKNLHHLGKQNADQLLNGFVSFLPLNSDLPDVEQEKRIQSIVKKI